VSRISSSVDPLACPSISASDYQSEHKPLKRFLLIAAGNSEWTKEKSFTGSINVSLNPDDNDYPDAGTFDRPASKVNKDL
jgi:hypothetical protein